MPDAYWLLVIVIALSVGFGVVNGFNDAANAIATVIGTRVLSPRNAIILATVFNFVGSATGLQVAKTIGKGILIPEAVTYQTAIAALVSVIIWGTLTTLRGLPISLHHGFIAGLVGAGIAMVGSGVVVWSVMWRVLSAVLIAPALGFVGGFIIMVALYWLLRHSSPSSVRGLFGNLQILSSSFVSYTHGLNDGQMAIAVMMMALVTYSGDAGLWEHVPWWVIFLAASSISFGTAAGGWQVIKTLGVKITVLRPVHGFAAETAAAIIIQVASLLGIPVSTTHCITASIMGVGATRRLSAVRWGLAGNIVFTWIITFPLCGGLGYLFAWLLRMVF